MKWLYLVLAVVGAVVPWTLAVPHFVREGIGVGPLVAATFANPVSTSFTADLLISGIAFWTFAVHQRLRARGPHPLPFVLITLGIGLSCALPAWLYARETARVGS